MLAAWCTLAFAAKLKDLVGSGPVVSTAERRAFDAPVPAQVTYLGPPRVEHPVLPLQVWGVRYDFDLVFETKHPRWGMHEYSRIHTPRGPVWIAKDSAHDGVQTITSSVPEPRRWLPEVPAPRVAGAVEVDERGWVPGATWEEGRGSLRLRYTTPDGEAAEVYWSGRAPTRPSSQRNGNTMGHSRQALAALLDIHKFSLGGRGHLAFGGVRSPFARVLGLLPLRFVLAQTQGGLAATDFLLSAGESPDTFRLRRPGDDTTAWPTEADERWTWSDGWAVRPLDGEQGLVTLAYHFVDGGLDRALATQWGMDVPAAEIRLQPALPDVRRPFEGTARSRFVVDVAGQEGHGVGEVTTRWEGDRVVLDVVPTAPCWFAERPLRMEIAYVEGGVRVRGSVVPAEGC